MAALTEKERETLRMVVRGHDAKSMARELGLSVHTINERLRDARRKLGVSSSREAARLLFAAEGRDPDSFADKPFREAHSAPAVTLVGLPDIGRSRTRRASWRHSGVAVMVFALALVAAAGLTQSTLYQANPPVAHASGTTADATSVEVEQAARGWLALLDAGRWADSFEGTTTSFRQLNTLAAWTAASQQARSPLGAARSRTLIAHDTVPGPPAGYEVLKFRTEFDRRKGAVETVSLAREDGRWRIVGIYID